MKIAEKARSFLADRMAEAVCLTGGKGEVLFLNPAGKKLFKSPEGPLKVWELFPPLPRNDALMQLLIDCVMSKRSTPEAEVDYENREGEVSRLHVSITCLEDAIPVFMILINNLTEVAKVTAALARYTSSEIADLVLNTPDGGRQGGRSAEVSVLMSDLRGFTAISEEIGADRLIRMLNHYFEAMLSVISRWRGTVIEFLGDGLFVVFGVPREDPEHALNAVSCAIEMENAMAEVNAWNEANGFPNLEMGIGISSGRVIAGNIGSDEKMKYGCIGEPVNTAGRIQSFTTRRQVFISEQTRNRIRGSLLISQVHRVLMKGKEKPVRIYEVREAGATRLLNPEETDEKPALLSREVPFTFAVMSQKSVEENCHAGLLLGITESGEYALIRTETELPDYTDLRFNPEGMAYAKVMGQEPDGSYRICFTQVSEAFRKWRAEFSGEQAPEGNGRMG